VVLPEQALNSIYTAAEGACSGEITGRIVGQLNFCLTQVQA
jgi:hypothetical protein